MSDLRDLPDPDTKTPPAMEGTWTLMAPDGRKWEGPSPLRVVGMELRERVPAEVGLARIVQSVVDHKDDAEVVAENEAPLIDKLEPSWSNTLQSQYARPQGGTIYQMLDQAISVSYPFFEWNGHVYRLVRTEKDTRGCGFADTGVLAKDLR